MYIFLQNNETALHLACGKGHDEVVRTLLAAKATFNTLNKVSNYASRRSRTRDTVKLTVCVCVYPSVPAVTAQRLQCDEN